MANDFGKRQQCKKAVIRDSNGKPIALVLAFRHGESERLDFVDVAADQMLELAVHGAKQKAGDEGARETVTTSHEFQAAVRAMFDRIISGTAFERQAGGGFAESDLAKAVAEFKSISIELATEFLKPLSATNKAKLKVHPPIKTVLDRLMLERAGDGGDAEELLVGLESKK